MSESTTIKISQNASRQLTLISEFADTSKGQIIEDFILDLFRAFRPQISNSLETGNYIGFDYQIKAEPKVDMVKGQYLTDINTPREETDKTTWALVTKAFEKLDAQKEVNKIKFRQALDRELPRSD